MEALTGGRAGASPAQRYAKDHDCPVCRGRQNDKRRRSERCYGMLSDDGRFAYCSREEYAGNLTERSGPLDTFTHYLRGPCRCGQDHGSGAPLVRLVPPTPQRAEAPKAPKVYKTIPDRLPGAESYRLVVTYPYRDADGAMVYTIARYEGLDDTGERDKQLRPFCPVAGGWVMRRADVCLLYRLPELLAADPWAPVYICEGEKDADRLAAAGLIATTNAFGASSWHMVADAAERLTGRNAVMIEDNDEHGRDRTEKILSSLADKAATVRMMRFPDLPEHGDVSDWLDAGHTTDELHRLAAALPIISARSVQDENPCPAPQDAPPREIQKTCPNCQQWADRARIAEDSLVRLRWKENMREKILALPPEQLSPAVKPAAIAVVDILTQTKARDTDGMVQVYRAEIARRTGTTDKVAGDHLIKIAKAGIVHREERRTFDHSELRIAEGPLFATPEQVESQAPKWGGKREKRCIACGSTKLKVHTLVCCNCGTQQSIEEVEKAMYEASLDENPCPAPQDAPPVADAFDEDLDADAGDATQDTPPPLDISIVSHLAADAQENEHEALVAAAREYAVEMNYPSVRVGASRVTIAPTQAAWEAYLSRADTGAVWALLQELDTLSESEAS